MRTDELLFDSIAVHAGRDDLAGLGVHALPIDLSTTNPLPDIERGGASYEVIAVSYTHLTLPTILLV